MNVPVDYICTSHGVVWRDNPLQIVNKYAEWANNYQEDQVTIIYDTMYNGTRTIAEQILKGIISIDKQTTVKLYNAATNDKNDIITEIFKSKAILIGSPTLNNGIMHSIAGLLEMIKGLKFKNKMAAAFGCYGWSDFSTKIIEKSLKDSGFEIISKSATANWKPNDEERKSFYEFGINFINELFNRNSNN